MKPFSIFTLSSILIFALNAQADPETADAVKHVQQDMSQTGFAKKSAGDSAAAKKTYEDVHSMTGSDENTDMVYGLAADVLGNMKDMSPEQMMKTLDDAQKNPQAFADSLTAEQKAKLKDISGRMPAAKTSTSATSSK